MSVARALEFLNRSEVFLASGSPRRRELFQRLNVPVLSHLAIPEAVENLDSTTFAGAKEYVTANVANKIIYALKNMSNRQFDDRRTTDNNVMQKKSVPDIVVAADTVVVDGKEILEKPKSSADNYRMIKQLSGKEHTVITAVSFVLPPQIAVSGGASSANLDGDEKLDLAKLAHTFTVETKIRLVAMDPDTISWYVNSGEGRDKAGGYAIQGMGAALTHSIQGCFYNVVGFPLNAFVTTLGECLGQ
ncbi:dTTP/UTP pyrophosphatase-like isoform X2 [Paramacrobiotus metropolitanus]|uniref:dTTP/UTP pyrophosphatase-like isoform X2 n=1 Tax=Paramacrobiotus metropolitanus TaxID=2943436 RepID=UPI0024456DB1|nr:dTTP/UTP pyrophosphatase-like isoform X2 [Paramacrobiotus metropolitanus]